MEKEFENVVLSTLNEYKETGGYFYNIKIVNKILHLLLISLKLVDEKSAFVE